MNTADILFQKARDRSLCHQDIVDALKDKLYAAAQAVESLEPCATLTERESCVFDQACCEAARAIRALAIDYERTNK